MKFYDGKFNSASKKEQIAKQWVRFLESGLKRSCFHQDIYKHLSLHLGFIAHYNIHGFYDERFADIAGRLQTFKQIIGAPLYYFNDENTSGNGDLNRYIQSKAVEFSEEIIDGIKRDKISELTLQRDRAQEELNR